MAREDSLDIFGSDPFGRDYLYGLSSGNDGMGLAPPPQGLPVDTRPYDRMQATPRGFISGLFSDVLGRTFDMPALPRTGIPALDLFAPNMNAFNRLSLGDVQKTAERISYGEPLTTGSGMTLRPREETIFAGMAVAPFAPFAPAVGRVIPKVVRATEGLPVGMGIKDVGKGINVSLNEASNFLSAKSEFGQVGGTIRPPDWFSDKPYLQINYAEVEKASRGKGKGKELYQSLIDEAQARGLRVFSDSTVEKPAVNVYKSLEKGGYKLRDMTTGSLEDGAVYGAGAKTPAFEISSAKSFQAPQQAALDLAQERAALPIEQGGLGLPANNTAADRAKAMGFDIGNPQYHATDVDFASINPSGRGKMGAGVYTSPNVQYAEKYAALENRRVLPLVSKGYYADADKRSAIFDKVQEEVYANNPNVTSRELHDLVANEMKNRGYSGFDVDKERLTFNPSDLRSRFAAFDPFRKDVATATAMGVALPDLLAQPVEQYPTPYETSPMYTDPFGNTIGSSIR
jgi:GNAT superfamily N-acetyltransferase